MTFRATYRLQLGPGLGFREARGARPVPARPRDQPPLPLAVAAGALAARRTATTSSTRRRISDELGGEDAFRELARAPGSAIVLDIVPNHMAASDENPFWRDPELRAKFFDVDTRTGFHRRFFDIGELAGVRMEDPEVFEATHAQVLELVARRARRRAADRPSRRARRPARLPRAAAPRRRRARLGGEDPRARRGAARLAGRGDGRLRVPERRDGALRRPGAARSALTALYEELTGERAPVRRARLEAKLAGRRGDLRARARARCAQEVDVPDLARRARLASTSTAPTSSRGAAPSTAADREAIAAAALSERLERILLLDERGHDAFVTRFQQTTGPVMAKGVEDTAFYRYLRLAR